MGLKEDSIAARLAQLQQAQSDALGGAFDDGVASNQSEDVAALIAAAVAAEKAIGDAALEALKVEDAKILAEQHAIDDADDAALEAAAADLSVQVQALEASKLVDAGVIASFQAKIDAIKALLA